MLLAQVKAAQLAARRAKDSVTASSLTTLIGEVEMVAKNECRTVSDEDVVTVTKKFVKNINETIKALTDNGQSEGQKMAAVKAEKALYEQFLPKQAGAEEIEQALRANFSDKPNKGDAMKFLKTHFGGNYDGKMAAQVVDAFLKG